MAAVTASTFSTPREDPETDLQWGTRGAGRGHSQGAKTGRGHVEIETAPGWPQSPRPPSALRRRSREPTWGAEKGPGQEEGGHAQASWEAGGRECLCRRREGTGGLFEGGWGEESACAEGGGGGLTVETSRTAIMVTGSDCSNGKGGIAHGPSLPMGYHCPWAIAAKREGGPLRWRRA